MASPRTNILLHNLDFAFDTGAWHGATLLGSLRGLTPEKALWRPAPGRKCIWELLLHTAYWKYRVRRWLTGAPKGTFGRKPANWPAPTDLRADIAFLEEEHRLLCAAVAEFDADALYERPTAKGPTWLQLILGVAAHDTHHTGQIQLLKRLHATSRRAAGGG